MFRYIQNVLTNIVLFLLMSGFFACESRTITYYSTDPGGHGGGSNTQHIFFDFSGINLTRDSNTNMYPVLSPSQDLVVYQSKDSDNPSEIYSISVDGSIKINLSDSPEEDTFPAFSPDGDNIAFFRNDSIYMMNSDGSNQRRISSFQADSRYHLGFVENGRYLIATVMQEHRRFIGKIKTDGSEDIILNPSIEGFNSRTHQIRSLIVFVGGQESNQDVFFMGSDGVNVVNVSVEPGQYFDPIISPNGEYIAYSRRDNPNEYFQVYIVNYNQSTKRKISGGYTDDLSPVFTP
ncbi:hypothetical protein ACFL7D_12270, partial [candidate division KSB1 bacterium]